MPVKTCSLILNWGEYLLRSEREVHKADNETQPYLAVIVA